ncbi:hypothetical protein BOC57_11290 [Burkholderia pseudomallei]|nr:hypothetical protein BOC57_11290 [Burkholderia pseudomallei]
MLSVSLLGGGTVLPDTDHVARTCKKSSLDQETNSPTPASFEFRLGEDGKWKDAYLSVNWLEYLLCGNADVAEKLSALRQYQVDNPFELALIKPTKGNVYAVVPVAAVSVDMPDDIGVELECHHEPHATATIDPHSGVLPQPGVDTWPSDANTAAHLAVQQILFQAICHWEKGILD